MLQNANYGPYATHKFLKSGKAHRPIPMRLVTLRRNDRIIGFDMLTDDCGENRARVFVKGVLQVKRDMLTDEGCGLLSQALSERASRNTNVSATKPIPVLVIAELLGFPVYRHDLRCFHITTRDFDSQVEHYFLVEQLSVGTYDQSRTYILKHMLLDRISRIVAANKSIPLADRTPRWLAVKYMSEGDMRGVYDDEDEEDEEDETRNPRPIHRCEAYYILARFRTDIKRMIKKERQSFDMSSWIDFCSYLDRLDDDERFTEKICDELEKKFKDPNEIEELPSDIEPMDEDDMDDPDDNVETFTFNDDGRTPSDDEDANVLKKRTRIQQDVYYRLPLKLIAMAPHLDFTHDITWKCPEDGCGYKINFVSPPETLQKWMNREQYNFLVHGFWDREDSKFKRIFRSIYETHLYEHLRNEGIQRVAKRRLGKTVLGRTRVETVKLSRPHTVSSLFFDYHFVWAKDCVKYPEAPVNTEDIF